jgi:hypothetical protein
VCFIEIESLSHPDIKLGCLGFSVSSRQIERVGNEELVNTNAHIPSEVTYPIIICLGVVHRCKGQAVNRPFPEDKE